MNFTFLLSRFENLNSISPSLFLIILDLLLWVNCKDFIFSYAPSYGIILSSYPISCIIFKINLVLDKEVQQENISLLRRILGKRLVKNKNETVAFIDLQKALDIVKCFIV